MASLAFLALDQLPIAQIWDQDLLNSALPPDQIQYLEDRITLQGLYEEGLLTSDPDLVTIALKKGNSRYIWAYLDLDRDVSGHEEDPFSEQGEEMAKAVYGLNEEEFQQRRLDAVSSFASDLESFLGLSGQCHNYNEINLAWGRSGDDWKVLYIGVLESSFGQGQIGFYSTLDEMLADLGEVISFQRLISQRIPVRSLSSSQAKALDGMKTSLQVESESMWDLLEVGTITLTSDFELSLRQMTLSSSLFAVDDYMYIIPFDDQDLDTSDVVYYSQQDALLILTSLFIEGNTWDHYPD